MRRLLVTLLFLSTIYTANAVCDYSAPLFDWTGSSPIDTNQWENFDEFGNIVYPPVYVNSTYISLDQDYLYIKFDLSGNLFDHDRLLYTMQIRPNLPNLDYYRFTITCDEILGILKKPTTGAAINLTVSPGWQSLKDRFEISVQEDSFEIKMPLDFLGYPNEMSLELGIYHDSQWINNLQFNGWNIDLCSNTGIICGDSICEGYEDYAIHPCVCPNDCPDMDTTCMGTLCGDNNCESDETIVGSICECPEDCSELLGSPCPTGETAINWSDSVVIGSDNQDWRENFNGTDLSSIIAKADLDRLYLKFELAKGQVPYDGLQYYLTIRPWNGVEYMSFRLECGEILELLEKRQSPTIINYTSGNDWDQIKNNFTVAVVGNSIELSVTWYAIYRTNGFDLEWKTFSGNEEIDQMATSASDIKSLFASICGDRICTEEEKNPENFYQYCDIDCPDAPERLWGNGVCDEGESERWGYRQFVWDCPENFSYILVDDGIKYYGTQDGETTTDDGIGPLIAIGFVVIVIFGLITLFRKLFGKLTSGRRKVSDMKKRLTQIESDKKDLQRKFMETRISESEFKEKMESLDREKQNLDLELKNK